MRKPVREMSWRAALVGACLAVSACQQEAGGPSEPATPPSNAEREAAMAAEQLAALGGAANAAQRARFAGEFQASGGISSVGVDEGAWELRLLDDYAQFSRPGLGEDGGLAGERDYRERGFRVVAGPLTVTILEEACSTPSGVDLPYVANVLFEGVSYQGCARSGIDDSARPTWASVLPDLIPAIDVCLARAGRGARVTFASALDEAQVSVRISEADGGRRECIAGATGAQVNVYETLADIDRRSGEGDPEFQRGGARPEARRCREVEEAVDREGESLGWLIRQTC